MRWKKKPTDDRSSDVPFCLRSVHQWFCRGLMSLRYLGLMRVAVGTPRYQVTAGLASGSRFVCFKIAVEEICTKFFLGIGRLTGGRRSRVETSVRQAGVTVPERSSAPRTEAVGRNQERNDVRFRPRSGHRPPYRRPIEDRGDCAFPRLTAPHRKNGSFACSLAPTRAVAQPPLAIPMIHTPSVEYSVGSRKRVS